MRIHKINFQRYWNKAKANSKIKSNEKIEKSHKAMHIKCLSKCSHNIFNNSEWDEMITNEGKISIYSWAPKIQRYSINYINDQN